MSAAGLMPATLVFRRLKYNHFWKYLPNFSHTFFIIFCIKLIIKMINIDFFCREKNL